ncbi:MAG: hypothetical protein E6Q89_07340 [Bacteroidia bacterium]|nr:MAG: hypothetical protein E6Q89_07340 [Bacteroidia bacterium]
MILPHPESDLRLNIMVLGADLIEQLKGQDFVLVESLLEKFLKKGAKRTPDMFFNSLTFLYSCGAIERKDYKIRLIVKSIKQTSLFD